MIRCFFFADCSNVEMLVEKHMPAFYTQFYSVMTETTRCTGYAPAYTENWGSGLYCVFTSVHGCAAFGIEFIKQMRLVDWTQLGLPAHTNVRLGMYGIRMLEIRTRKR